MLKFFIEMTTYLSIFAFLFGVIIYAMANAEYKWTKISVLVISLVGFISSVAMIIFKRIYPQQMVKISLLYNRLALTISMIFILLALVALVCYIFKSDKIKVFLSLFSILATISTWFLAFTIIPQIVKLTTEFIAFGETSFGTQSLIRLGGYVLGIVIAVIIAISVYKIANKLKDSSNKLFLFLITLISTFDISSRGIAALARLRILKSKNPLVFKIMIFEDRSTPYIIFFFMVVAAIFSFYVYINNIKLIGNFKTNAARRIVKATMQNSRRWAITFAFFSIMAFLTVSVIKSYANKPVELSPPQEYITEGDMIVIPLEGIDDGHLHRFSYKTAEGNDVRFIAIKKPKGGSYGLGLDACEICGIAGYFERDDQIVCKRCDVVMNKATIGFRGGCNPIPFEYEIKDKKIYISKAVLEKEKYRFPVGD